VTAPPDTPPEPGTLHVWVLDLTEPWCDALADSGVVSEVERARARRMADAALGRKLLARRSAMRFVLGRYVGRAAAEVDVVAAPGGKPVLLPRDDRTLAFSVGHSGDLYGIALGSAAAVGFDLERLRGVRWAGDIARRWFSQSEAEELEGLDGEALESAFMRLWTAKEALAKRHGAGLRLMMRGEVAELDIARAERSGHLRWLTPRPRYRVAVASSDPIQSMEVVVPEDDAWIA